MTTFAPSAKPAWAVVAWCDDRAIYIELPCKEGPPYIQKFDLTEGGLSKALHMMKDARKKLAKPSEMASFSFTEHPKLKRNQTTEVSAETRAKARDVLRRLKMIGK